MKYEIIDLKNKDNSEKKDYKSDLIFFSDEWEDRNQQIMGFLFSKDGKGEKLNARECIVKEILSLEAKTFLDDNHIQISSNLSLVFCRRYF